MQDEGDRVVERFDGRTIIVTGAASGIGAATTRRLVGEGANVVAVDLSADSVERTLSDVTQKDRILAMTLDVADCSRTESVFEAAVERFGELHGLVNCAGVRG